MLLPSLLERTARALRSARGAFDLPSIITGVVVVAILTTGVFAAVFGVIPFAQDNGAKQDLAAVRTAEGVARSKDGKFLDADGLFAAGYLSRPLSAGAPADATFQRVVTVSTEKPFAVKANDEGTCYVSVARSMSGKIFAGTNIKPDPFDLLGTEAVLGCLSEPDLQELIDSVGGLPAAAASTVPANLAMTATTASDADFAWDPVQGATGYLVEARINNGPWATVSASQPATSARVPASAGSTVEARVASLTASGTSAFSKSASAVLQVPTTGPLAVWGHNASGEYGVNRIDYNHADSSKVPVAGATALTGKVITSFSPGITSCAVADAAAYCWGDNTYGQTGTGKPLGTDIPVPTLVSTAGVLAGKQVSQISAADQTVCAVADGAAYCWGYNSRGELGNNKASDSGVPVAVLGALAGKTVTSVNVGQTNVCAVADGKPYCWGDGRYGVLGTGYTGPNNSYVAVAVDTSGVLSGKSVSSVSVGAAHACAVADGAAYCWGNGSYGELGSATPDGSRPVAVDMTGALAGKQVTSLATGYAHTCAVADGAVYCWGQNQMGQVGDGTNINRNRPVAVDTAGVLSGRTVTAVTAYAYTSGVIAGGRAITWGQGGFGALGNGGTANSSVPVNVDTSGLLSGRTVISFRVGGSNTLAMYY